MNIDIYDVKGEAKRKMMKDVVDYHDKHLEEYNDFVSRFESFDPVVMNKLSSFMATDGNAESFYKELSMMTFYSIYIKKLKAIIGWMNRHLKMKLQVPTWNEQIMMFFNKERRDNVLVKNVKAAKENGDPIAYYVAYYIQQENGIRKLMSIFSHFIADAPKLPVLTSDTSTMVGVASNIDIRKGIGKRKTWREDIKSGKIIIEDEHQKEEVLQTVDDSKEPIGRPSEVGKFDFCNMLTGPEEKKKETMGHIKAFIKKYSKGWHIACLYYILRNDGHYCNDAEPLIGDYPYDTFHKEFCKAFALEWDSRTSRDIYKGILSNKSARNDEKAQKYFKVIDNQLPEFYT